MGSTPRWRKSNRRLNLSGDGLARGELPCGGSRVPLSLCSSPRRRRQVSTTATLRNRTSRRSRPPDYPTPLPRKGRRRSSARRCRRAQAGDDAARAGATQRSRSPNASPSSSTSPGPVTTTASSTASSTTRPPPPSRRFSATASSRKPAPSIRRSALCSPPQRRRKRPKSAGGWSTTPSAARLSACRPGRCRTRARPQRHPLGLGARAGSGRDVQDQRTRDDARRGVRAAEEGAAHAQARGQPAASGFLHPLGHAEPEEVLRARRDQGRRSARHDRALRPGDGAHHGSRRGRDVEHVHAVPRCCRHRADRGTQAQGGIRHRHRGERGRPRSHRPPGDRGLQRDRGGRIRRCRPPGGGHEGRPRAVAGFRRARSRARELRRRRPKGPDLTLVGIADPQAQGGGGTISTRSAKLRGDTLEPAPQPGFPAPPRSIPRGA